MVEPPAKRDATSSSDVDRAPSSQDDIVIVPDATSQTNADVLLVAKHGVDGVYDSDPRHNPNATRYSTLTYDEAISSGIQVMDTSAFVLANEQGLTMHVFDVGASGVMRRICEGEDLGTRISNK